MRATVRQFLTAQGPFLASGLAFDLLLYCVPLLFLILSVMGFLLARKEQIEVAKNLLTQVMPGAHQVITENLTMIVASRNQSGLIGFLLFIMFSMTMFGSARTALNAVMAVTRPGNFFIGKGVDLLVSVFFAGLFGLTIAVLSLLSALRGLTDRIFFLGAILRPGWMLLSEVLGFLFTAVLFYVLYRFCPARTCGRNALSIASLAGAGLFEISKWVFAWYVSRARDFALVHGTLNGLLFFLLWVYYACVVFLFAGALGWAVDRETASLSPRGPLPGD
ncbi:MAG TPA: YihY/virulence factor BrkB family protein [Nitrospiria bacterium]|nr:YihY/virulence factor BrkB family protein [Nitrospiria bacterium]